MLRTFVLVLASGLLASGAMAQGQLAFDAPRHDFGTFTEGETVTHVFAFTNTGDAPLALTEVDAACGCTTPSWTEGEIAPGARGQVTVAYDSAERPGPFEKTVQVGTKDSGEVTLRIVGNVVAEFVARGVPMGSLTFENDRQDIAPEASGGLRAFFRFQHTGDRPVRISAVEASDDRVQAVFPNRPVYSGDVMGILLTVDDALASGETLTVRVMTDDAEEPVKTLQARVVAE